MENRKYFFLLVILYIFHYSSYATSQEIIKKASVSLKFATMKLLSETTATKPQIFQLGGTSQIYSGGGLQFIEPGAELLANLYLDDEELHRGIIGTEFLALKSLEKMPNSSASYLFAKHKVSLFDIFFGYHYAFWDMKWQNAKLYCGPEIMLNTMLNNKFEGGMKYLASNNDSSHNNDINRIISTTKNLAFRIGGRIRIGVEGQIIDNWYVNSSFSIGIYNFLLRNSETGELFNSKNEYETQEQLQTFYNFNVGIQYNF